jgi:hypothetical protein
MVSDAREVGQLRMSNKPPGKGKKGSTGAVSRVIGARLHPKSCDEEKEALATYDAKVGEGFTPREILTDALLRAAGYTPEMFRPRQERVDGAITRLESKLEVLDSIEGRLDALQDMVESSIGNLLRQIRSIDPEGLRRFASADDEEDGGEFSDDFIKNARRAVRPSLNQLKKKEDRNRD